jgi:hypothetical protein
MLSFFARSKLPMYVLKILVRFYYVFFYILCGISYYLKLS